MKYASVFLPVLILLITGCATLSEKSRLANFSRAADAYEQALRISDYASAAHFLDPASPGGKPDPEKYKNIKIVEYKVTHVDVSQNGLEIRQDVTLQYFLLNSNRLRTIEHPQIWRYREKEKVWLLQTGLPVF